MTDEESAEIEAKVRYMAERERERLAKAAADPAHDCRRYPRLAVGDGLLRCAGCNAIAWETPAPEPSELDRLRALVRELASMSPKTFDAVEEPVCAFCLADYVWPDDLDASEAVATHAPRVPLAARAGGGGAVTIRCRRCSDFGWEHTPECASWEAYGQCDCARLACSCRAMCPHGLRATDVCLDCSRARAPAAVVPAALVRALVAALPKCGGAADAQLYTDDATCGALAHWQGRCVFGNVGVFCDAHAVAPADDATGLTFAPLPWADALLAALREGGT